MADASESKKPELKGLKYRQEEADRNWAEFIKTDPKFENEGDWRWRDYGVDVKRTSVVVIGERVVGDQLELIYLITVYSQHPIPHAGCTRRVERRDKLGRHGLFTYVQLGNSVFTPNMVTIFMSPCTGSDPPTVPVPPG
jgi:hypothetical protein